jgi:mRNA interferase MazF
VRLGRKQTGLPKDSVANVSQVVSIDRSVLSDRVGRVSKVQLRLILNGMDIVLGREADVPAT